MGWMDINYSCGHFGRQQMLGPYKERLRKKAWLEKYGRCPECYKAKRRREEKAAGPKFSARILAGGAVELTCYQGSYHIREELGGRGWRFDREIYAPIMGGGIDLLDILSAEPKPGWIWIMHPDERPDQHGMNGMERIEAEAYWIADNGWNLHLVDHMEGLLQAVLEGRPDVARLERGA